MNDRTLKKKLAQFAADGYSHIQLAEFKQFLAYRWKQKKISGWLKERNDLKQVTVNDFFDYQQMLVETADESKFNWHQIDDVL